MNMSWEPVKSVPIQGERVIVRDYGRIPLGKVVDVVSKMNTGGNTTVVRLKNQ
jgi:hypothetical protein